MTERRKSLIAWCQHVLDDQSVAIETVIADASTRAYARITTRNGSRVVMDAPDQQASIEQFSQVAERLRNAGLEVPKLIAAMPELGFVLMTDFGDATYFSLVRESSTTPSEATESLYRAAIDSLVTMQKHASVSDLPDYDRAFLRREMQLFPKWLLDHRLSLELSNAQQMGLQACFEILCEVASSQPRVFVHRDYHSRNLMRLEHGGPGILDFQDAVCGPLCYDLVSLLRDVYVEWPEEQVDRWVDYYCGSAGALTAGVDDVQFRRWFDLTGLQRHLKIAGLFVRLDELGGKSGYLRDIPLTLKYIERVCARYPEMSCLLELLDEWQVAERLQRSLKRSRKVSS